MTRRLLASALIAGLAAGLATAALQQWFTVPVIQQAELYETGALTHPFAEAAGHDHASAAHGAEAAHDHGADQGAAAEHDHHAHDHGEGPGPLTRAGLTMLNTVLAMAGFGLIMTAGFALAERFAGVKVDLRAGLLWGGAGFICTQLATGIGLPPELPGSAAEALEARQAWWALAAVSSALGLGALAFLRGPVRFIGLALLALPHIVGAPHPELFFGVAPPELAGLFAARALAVGAVGWLVLGAVAGHLWSREDPAAA